MLRRSFASFLVFASLLTVAAERPAAAQAPADPIARVVSIVVQSISFDDEAGEVIATALVTLDVAGQTVERLVEIPLALDGSPNPADANCNILNLAVGPIDLDLLGLVVELDDCNGGPVTIDIYGDPGPGNLLGNLVCGVAGLLGGGLDLGGVLALLSGDQLDLLRGALQDALNDAFAGIIAADQAVAPASHEEGGGGHQCDILTLEVPEGLTLDILGLVAETSPICLDVYAERGPGNLLGNLLCNVVGLLDRGNSGNAVQALLRQVGRILSRL